jgi:hypothetical protein
MKRPMSNGKRVELDTPDSPVLSQILACSRPATPLIGPFEMQIANGPPSFPRRVARGLQLVVLHLGYGVFVRRLQLVPDGTGRGLSLGARAAPFQTPVTGSMLELMRLFPA